MEYLLFIVAIMLTIVYYIEKKKIVFLHVKVSISIKTKDRKKNVYMLPWIIKTIVDIICKVLEIMQMFA